MIIPVRCFTCNKPISSLWLNMRSMSKEDGMKYLAENTDRYCCRAALLTTKDLSTVVENGNFTHEVEQYMMELETVIPNSRKVRT